MPIYKGSTKLGTVYHGGTKIEKGYKGPTLVYGSEKIFVVKYIKDTYAWAQGLLGDSIYKPGQQLLFGTLSGYPLFQDPFSFKIKEITPTSLTDSAGNVYPTKRVVYIGDIPFIGWSRPSTVQIYTGCDELLTAPGALIGDTALGGGIGMFGGGTVVTSDDGVTISFTAYNHQGGVFQTGSFQRSTSTLSSNYLYRG